MDINIDGEDDRAFEYNYIYWRTLSNDDVNVEDYSNQVGN